MKDPYDILGVSRQATQDEIKRAYRRLAREKHPDTDPGNPWAEREFKDLSAAYDLLSDDRKRAAFDRGEIDADGNRRGRRTRNGGPGGAGTGAGAGRGGWNRESAFDQFFRQKAKRERSSIKVRGANVDYSLKVSFLEAVRGTTKRVGMTTGKHLEVKVPAGTRDGQVLRLKGQGMQGIGGGEPGDALVEITVEPHPAFTRRGDDLHLETPVTLPEAVLGGRIEVATIDGPVTMTVPANANTGTTLRLRGKGVARADGSRGDQYVTLKVMLPPEPDDELVAFVTKWSARNPYDARRKTNVD